jgi:dihydroneopterin aldolase
MGHIVRQAQWEAEVAASGHYDKIMVQNLEVVVNAGKDVWGREKKQRALISVTLTLGKQFTSASSTDSVDDSTVHYGTLSKAIQTRFTDDAMTWMSTVTLSTAVSQCVRDVAGSTDIYAIETDVCYLKGSMFGEGAGHMTSRVEKSGVSSNVLYLRNVRIPCLIGVNANERLQKQPVVLNVWVNNMADSRVEGYPQLETFLFEVCAKRRMQTHRLTDIVDIWIYVPDNRKSAGVAGRGAQTEVLYGRGGSKCVDHAENQQAPCGTLCRCASRRDNTTSAVRLGWGGVTSRLP